MTRLATIALSLICFSGLAAEEIIWQVDLAQPNAGFETYHGDDTVQVTVLEEDGQAFVRAQAPGERNLEGIRINSAPVLAGGTRATARVQVRGSGEVWLMAHSRNGWLYSRRITPLTENWQTIELTKPLALDDDRMSVALLTREAGAMTLDVRSLEVFAEPVPFSTDVEVAPIRIEAEALSASPRHIEEVEEASGGAVVSGTRHALLTGIPTPHTNRPLYLYGRVRMADEGAYWSIVADTGEGAQGVARLEGETTRDWQWLRGGPFTAAMMGESFRIQLHGPADTTGGSALDYILLTTDPEASPEQLEAAPEVPLTGPARLAIGRAPAPPTLDGVADDAAWQSAIALTGFTRTNTQVPAMHQSEMRLSWDDENLYWWFRGEEPVLRTEMQRLADFLQNVEERDGPVWQDDSILLIVDTGDGIFDFFVNGLGTVNDSRIGDALQMWTSRDESFQADIEVATHTGEGYWTMEARIGLAGLGVASASESDTWRFIAGRLEKADNEASAWNLVSPGFHDPLAFAHLHFMERTPGAVVTVPEPLQPGANEVHADLTGAPQGVLLGTGAGEEGAVLRRWSLGVGDDAVLTPLPVEEEGRLRFRYALLDAATLVPLMLSPEFTRSVRSSTATIALTTDAPWTLRVNGERVGAGQSATAEQPLEVFLQKGPNALGLELEGRAQVMVEAGDLAVTQHDPWRVAPEDIDDPSVPELDPRNWEIAGGEALEPGGYRFTVLWEDTHTFPNSQPALFIAQGTAQHYTVAAKGLRGHLLEGYRCHFWLPPGLELVAVTGYYGTREEQPKYDFERVGEERIDGASYVHYVVTTNQMVPYRETVRILELFNPFFAWREDATPEDRDYRLYFAAEALGGSIREARQHIIVRPMPPLEGVQPELVWQLWGGFFAPMNRPEAKALTMKTARAAGFTSIVAGDRETSDLAAQHGMENVLSVNFESWSINMRPWLEENPAMALIDRSGELSNSYVCTSAMLNEARPFMQSTLQTMVEERRPNWVDWDYESNVMTSYLSCFCTRCLDEFREYAGIGGDVTLDGEIIEREHPEPWMRFMNLRMAQVALQMKETVNGADPPTPLQIYSGYQSADTMWRYGVDWSIIGELNACDIAACGYGRNWERISATHEALAGIPLVLGRLMRPYDRNSTEEVVPLTRAVLLRRLMDCTGGILVYDRPPLEGRSWHASAEVSRLAAAHGEVFAQGEFIQVNGVPFEQDWIGGRSHGDEMIVALMNTTSANRTLKITLPEGYTTCIEFFSDEPATGGAEMSLELAPGDARAWVLRR